MAWLKVWPKRIKMNLIPNHPDEKMGERPTLHRLQGFLKGETNGRILSIEEINEAIIDGCLAANHPNLPRTTRINTLAPTSINTSGKS